MGFGICDKKKIIKNNFRFIHDNKDKHATFMMLS